MISSTEAYYIAMDYFPELNNKFSRRVIDSLPEIVKDYLHLIYPHPEEFWLVQFSSLPVGFEKFGASDYTLCFHGIWISKKSGRILWQGYYFDINGLDIKPEEIKTKSEEDRIEFEKLVRIKSMDNFGFVYSEENGWKRKIPLENPPRINLDLLKKNEKLNYRARGCQVVKEFELD